MSVANITREAVAKVIVYSTLLCPFCHRAKALLRKKGVAFTEIDVGMDAEKRAEMTKLAHGKHTVPQIFIGETHVGGCDDLHALDSEGKLDSILARS
ncbi:MAG: glutaredoxin 3 [Alphaproteobacteria bacterium]|nr:glutaredoxin 3 [Alphaproteobacteria bacterium]